MLEISAGHAQEELESHPNSDWIKVEPKDSIDLAGVLLSDNEDTEYEELDDDHDEGTGDGEGWVDLFEAAGTGSDSHQVRPKNRP